jgi:hypothetical protein
MALAQFMHRACVPVEDGLQQALAISKVILQGIAVFCSAATVTSLRETESMLRWKLVLIFFIGPGSVPSCLYY